MANRKMTFSKTKTAGSVIKQLGVSAALLAASTNAGALGLGSLEVQSNLDQPLNGTIELRTAPTDDLSSVKAVIASRDDFESLGIDYPTYLQNISLTIEESGGRQVLRVVSNDVVIKEPFIHFLVRVDWSGGSFLREYTALIDPPVYAAETPRAEVEPRAVGTDQSYQADLGGEIDIEPLDTDEIIEDAPVESDVSSDAAALDDELTDELTTEAEVSDEPLIDDDFYETPEEEAPVVTDEVPAVTDEAPLDDSQDFIADGISAGIDAKYGPVARGESLSVIAAELQSQFPDLSIYQIMKVLFEENPDSFINSNINGLIQGAVLNIGDLDAIRAVDIAESRAFYSAQIAEWDPSVLVSDTSESINVGQDEYAFDDSVFDDDSGVSVNDGIESFQVGASNEADSLISSDQGDSREGEVLALRQEITQLETALASSELENQELTERISSLEGQLADMNRLMNLSVEDAGLAQVESTLAAQNDGTEALTDSELATTSADSDIQALDEFLSETDAGEDASELDSVLASAGLDDTADESADLLGEFSDDESALDEFTSDFALDGEDEAAIDTDATASVEDFLSDTTEEVAPVDSVEDEFADIENEINSVLQGTDSVATDTSASEPAESKSFVDSAIATFVDGGLWKVVAGIGGLLAAGMGLLFWRRRRADEEFEVSMLSIESNSQSIGSTESMSQSATMSTSVASVAEAVPDKETSFLTVYSDSDAVVQADEVDPVAEADVYIAYGRDEQAEEVLLDGIASNPERIDIKQKLLGLYHKNENAEGYERIAEELYSQRELVDAEIWEEVSQMGKEVAPDNPLFNLSVDDLSAAKPSISDASAEPAALDESEVVDTVKDEVTLDDDDSVHLTNLSDETSEISELDNVAIDTLDIEIDKDDDVIDFSDADLDSVVNTDGDDDSIAFDTELTDDAAGDTSDAAGDAVETSVSEVPEVSDLEIDADYDEARTQYELAKVFVDLGDEDGALKILNELVANDSNDESVLNDARELLDSIKS